MKVSIIMATYDKRDYLEYTLASLAGQTHSDFELVLCDDGTEGGVADLIAPYRDRFAIVPLVQANAGRAAARNTALARASGDLVVFSDDDRILPPEFLAAHVSAHSAGGEEDLAVIGWKKRGVTVWIPRMLPVDESDLTTLARRVGGVEPLASPLRTIEPGDVAVSYPVAVSRMELGDEPDNYHAIVDKYGDELADFRFGWVLATTANLSVPRALLDKIGGFDDGFQGWGVEDTDLSYRLWQAGTRFRIERAAVNHHQVHPIGTGNALLDNRRRRAALMANVEFFCRKHQTLEAYLFKRRWEHAMTLDEANRLLAEVEAGVGHSVREELLRLYAAA
ncbi:glycosyl transferase family 2 [Catenulispora acidiphila DSM 44928]|uniref:Glycosyl transferase family 2 n=1 Tax=Catenulispora acidiphila (strain DSM 44928 / JCM 14897 / NBRC 102108 / NRRL B-24433 / ID139908) TaxID=479433 RepID=C7PX79_CATAD|nr:glycosyltransferase [Catenulispora acidiphila]ACU69430.1 glycosyl transferase family 2 [Catenulispora acidiphila DSM 44928]